MWMFFQFRRTLLKYVACYMVDCWQTSLEYWSFRKWSPSFPSSHKHWSLSLSLHHLEGPFLKTESDCGKDSVNSNDKVQVAARKCLSSFDPEKMNGFLTNFHSKRFFVLIGTEGFWLKKIWSHSLEALDGIWETWKETGFLGEIEKEFFWTWAAVERFGFWKLSIF